jgi:hypothetical protein
VEILDHLSLRCPFAQCIWVGFLNIPPFPLQAPGMDSSISMWWPDAVAHLSRAEARLPTPRSCLSCVPCG